MERVVGAALIATVAIGYGIAAAFVLLPASHTILGLLVALCGIAASIALAVLLGRLSGWGFGRVLGEYSLEIFVPHSIASAGLRIVLQKVLKVQDVTTHIVLGTLVGLVVLVVLGRLSRKYHAEFLFRLR